MTTNTMLDTATVAIVVAEGGTGNAAAAYTDAYSLLLTAVGGVAPIFDIGFSPGPGVSGNFLVDSNSGTGPTWTALNAALPYQSRLLSFQILTSGTAATYTPTSAAVNTLIVEAIGGGGGGGGCTGAVTKYAASGGGGAGAYSRTVLGGFLGSVTATYTVGVGGNGASGTSTGTTGGTTSFTGITTVNGGLGSVGTTSVTTATGLFALPGANTASVTSSSSLIATSGCSGQYGFYSSVDCTGGSGASSVYGGGVIGPKLTSAGTTVGVAATGYGSGGSGCCSYLDATNTNQTGGKGSDGIIIIWEYS